MSTNAPTRSGEWLEEWDPEDPKKWDSHIAWRTLWITTFCLTLAFAAWFLPSAVIPKLNALGYTFSMTQLYWMAAMPGLSAGTAYAEGGPRPTRGSCSEWRRTRGAACRPRGESAGCSGSDGRTGQDRRHRHHRHARGSTRELGPDVPDLDLTVACRHQRVWRWKPRKNLPGGHLQDLPSPGRELGEQR